MVNSREREGRRGNIGIEEKKKVIMQLYEIMCVKLENCKALQNLKYLSFN